MYFLRFTCGGDLQNELFSFQKLIFLQIFTQMISGDNKLRKQELSKLDLKIISNVMELYHRATVEF